MRGCVGEDLGAYLEGDLEVRERARVEAHLLDCGRCRNELRDLRATVALLRRLPTPMPPRDLTPAVMARIDAEGRRSRWPQALPPLDGPAVLGLLAAGLACLALVGLWQPGGVDPAGSGSEPAPQREATGPQIAAGDDAIRRSRRPTVEAWSPAARLPRLQRVASFSSGVAPLSGFAELPQAATSQREREFDRQLERLMGDPAAFLARMGPDVRGERFARLAQHAARRGAAGQVANRLIAVSHPLADDLAPRFLAASLAADLERSAGLR